jgi:hypothetical protein
MTDGKKEKKKKSQPAPWNESFPTIEYEPVIYKYQSVGKTGYYVIL